MEIPMAAKSAHFVPFLAPESSKRPPTLPYDVKELVSPMGASLFPFMYSQSIPLSLSSSLLNALSTPSSKVFRNSPTYRLRVRIIVQETIF
jgi:hypothetical protein